jgi:hypothetical protein
MTHAKLRGRIQTLIQPSHIRFALKGLDVTISVKRLTGADLGRDVRKLIAIRFAHRAVFFADSRSVWSDKINRRDPRGDGKLVTQNGLIESVHLLLFHLLAFCCSSSIG